MLIHSPRHRPEDLELWAELEEADLLHYEFSRVAVKAVRAIETIQKFAADGPFNVSVSWGKDSVVAAHLCWLALDECLLWHLRGAEICNPSMSETRDTFLDRFDVAYGEYHANYAACETDTKRGKEFKRGLSAAGGRYVSGVRAEESGRRKMRMCRWGHSTDQTCAPIGWWTTADVFAYLAYHDLPTHPHYAMLGAGRWPRDQLRVSALTYLVGGAYSKKDCWEAEYYGDVLRRLESGK